MLSPADIHLDLRSNNDNDLVVDFFSSSVSHLTLYSTSRSLDTFKSALTVTLGWCSAEQFEQMHSWMRLEKIRIFWDYECPEEQNLKSFIFTENAFPLL